MLKTAIDNAPTAFHHQVDWANIPSAFLHAELTRREEALVGKPACGSGKNRGSYNTSLHVAALILILVLSTGACSFPIIVRRFPRLPVPHHFLFLSRHFGTGVLIATAFVHLLPTAFVSLTDPCLPAFWNDGYPAMAGLIAMTSVLVVVGIEMFFAIRGAGHVHGGEYDALPGDADSHGHLLVPNGHVASSRPRRDSMRPFRPAELDFATTNGLTSAAIDLPLSKTRLSTDHLVPTSPSSNRPPTTNPTPKKPTPPRPRAPNLQDPSSPPSPTSSSFSLSPLPPSPSPLTHHPDQKKLLLQCLLLEAGILFHSIFIGIALSVSLPPAFYILLVAISFHQTFEGLALGSRIAAATSSLPSTSPQPWLMALAYGTTTPLGQAVGLAVHNLYDPEGEAGLLMVGVMNAVSSGLLVFAGLVELLAEDFLSDRSYEILRGRRRLEACAAVVAGGVLMAVVGAWA